MQNSERPVDEPISQAAKKPSKKLWRRLLAGFMAVLLLGGLLLGYAAQIRFAQLNYLGTVLEHAAAVTADNTGYLNESGLQRAWNILRYAVGKPKTYDEYEMYASIAIARTEYAEAIPYMQGCIDLLEDGSEREKALLELRLGSLYALSDDAESAISCFDKALNMEPTLADAYLLRAQMHSLMGNQELAAADVRSYDQLAGENPAIRAAIGSLYEGAGDYRNAVACYTTGLEQSGGTDTDLLASRARCYVLLGDMGAARLDLISFFAEGGSDPTGEYNVMLGLCRMENGEYDLALQAFHNAVNAGYDQLPLIYSQCVLCAYILGDYATVISDGNKALEALAGLQEGDILEATEAEIMTAEELHHWIGLARMAGEDFRGAKEEFLMIGDFAKAPEGVLYYLGLCCASIGEQEQAIAFFTQSIEKGQMVSLCYYNRAVSNLQAGNAENGLYDLVAVLERNDDEDAVDAAIAMLEELGAELKVLE